MSESITVRKGGCANHEDIEGDVQLSEVSGLRQLGIEMEVSYLIMKLLLVRVREVLRDSKYLTVGNTRSYKG